MGGPLEAVEPAPMLSGGLKSGHGGKPCGRVPGGGYVRRNPGSVCWGRRSFSREPRDCAVWCGGSLGGSRDTLEGQGGSQMLSWGSKAVLKALASPVLLEGKGVQK